jgi:hypothetical protein
MSLAGIVPKEPTVEKNEKSDGFSSHSGARALAREPGIHNRRRGDYGFRTRRFRGDPE